MAKMSRNGRVMSDLHRRDGALARPDAIQEVLLVIGRGVELHLAQLSGEVLALLPRRVGAVKSLAIHPYPALGANPLHAGLDVFMPSGNGHRDALRIFQFETVFRSAVPHGIGGRQFAAAFYFQRTRAVEVETPVGNVAMVTDP